MTKIKSRILFVLGAIFILPIITSGQISSVTSEGTVTTNKTSTTESTSVKAESTSDSNTQTSNTDPQTTPTSETNTTKTTSNTSSGGSTRTSVAAPTSVSTQTSASNPVLAPKPVQVRTNTSVKVSTSENKSTTTTSVVSATTSKVSITNVTNSLNTIKDVSETTQAEIKAKIESDIHDSIVLIREQKDIEAYKLQNSISDIRDNLYKDIDSSFSNILDTNTKSEIKPKIDAAITNIENKLSETSGVKVDFSTSRQSVVDILGKYQEGLEKNGEVVKTPEIDLMSKDSDFDGLSDYDEQYIYQTDPKNARTVAGELTDGEKVSKGINPTSQDSEKINYEDPIVNTEAHVTELYAVTEVALVTDQNSQTKRLEFKGQALPNSYVTLYIFSTPVIVAVKTDERGEWQYTMDKELENGNHEIVVATVNNSGKILAKGNAIPFTKTAEAAVFGGTGIGTSSTNSGNFFQENYYLIILGILLAAITITLIFAGNKKVEEQDINSNAKPL